MDRVEFLIASAHVRLRLEYLGRHPELWNNIMPTPKLASLTQAMDMLEHDLEHGAGKLLDLITSIRGRGEAAYAKGHERMDGVSGRVADVEKYVTALEGSNGAPLPDSSSDASPSSQEPERLTVNGVSQG